MQLEQLRLAPSTINQRLAAVRRLAYEASDAGLLSPELAAGIRRVKGAKQLGVRLGNPANNAVAGVTSTTCRQAQPGGSAKPSAFHGNDPHF
jgi:hypothetical protein